MARSKRQIDSPGPTVGRRRMGAEMRRLREAADLTGEEVAELMEWSDTKLYRIERGEGSIRPKELRELLGHYGVTDEEVIEGLATLAQESKQRGWWSSYTDLISKKYASYIGFESGAAEIHTWEPMIVPGLLQTEDYARNLIKGGAREITEHETERRVEIRMKRQARLQKSPLRLWAIMDTTVFQRLVGGPKVLADQLRYLLETAEQPKVTYQVVPLEAGAHPGTLGSFTVFKFTDAADVVYAESVGGDVYPQGADLDACTLALDHLRAVALDHDAAIKEIKKALAKLSP